MEKNRKKGRAGKASYFVQAGPGKYVYSGPLYTFSTGRNITARQSIVCRLGFSIGMTVLSAVCGFLPVPGLINTFYVILPYAGCLICSAVSLWMAARIAYWDGDSLREYVYFSTIKRLPVLTVLCAIFAGIAIAGQALRIIIEGVDLSNLLLVIVFLFIHAVILGISLLWKRYENAFVWGKK